MSDTQAHVHPWGKPRLALYRGELVCALRWARERVRHLLALGGHPELVLRRDTDGMPLAYVGYIGPGTSGARWRQLDAECKRLGGQTIMPRLHQTHDWTTDDHGPVCRCHGYRGFRQVGHDRAVVRVRKCWLCKAPATIVAKWESGQTLNQRRALCERCAGVYFGTR